MSWQGVPCKVWTGARNKNGYGVRGIGPRSSHRTVLVHRHAWEEVHGPIPAETPYVLHHCDNPACYEVEHLFLGTQKDNMEDCSQKGRVRNQHQDKTHCDNGHPYDETNLYVSPQGGRQCRACKRAYKARAKTGKMPKG